MAYVPVLKKINEEVRDFQNKPITIVPGLQFNQYKTINENHFAYNSKYQTGDVDDDGDRKYYYNINRNPCLVFTKAIDFDSKNIRLLTVGGGNPLKTWFMERDLKYWMRDKQFGVTLNRIFKELPIMGSVVLKVIDGTPFFVDLRNFIVEQSADTLDDSNHIIEIHNMTVNQFRQAAAAMKWGPEKTEEVINLFYQMKNTSHIRVYERYGVVCDLTETGEVYTYKRVFHADVGVDEFDQQGNLQAEHKGVELSAEPWEGHPYWEFHAEKRAGRWLGVGVVESLREAQIRVNELANLQSKTSYWSALRVFQTRDEGVARNLLSDVRNGEVLHVDSEVTQIDMSDRNLAFFNDEHQRWLANRDEMTFSYDVVQGERLPAGTPLGSAQLAVSQTLTYFEGVQENVALAVKEMLYQAIIPHFEKEQNLEHTLRLVGQDLDQYIQMIKNELVFKEAVRMAVNFGKIPTNEEAEAIGFAVEAAIKGEKEKLITIPTNFYKDVKYDIDIDITGESIDTRVRSATLFAILQAIQSDPTMTEDETKRKILFKVGEDGGVNMNDLLTTPRKNPADMVPGDMQKKPGGGGVSAPALDAAVPGAQMQTV